MEKLDLYNYKRQKTDKIISRDEKIPQNYYRLVVHACIFNSKGELLIQQRTKNKKHWPCLWDLSVGGGVQSGEDSQDAIKREVMEELGVEIDNTNLSPAVSINFSQGFDDTYIIKMDVDINDLILQQCEVQRVKWATKKEVFQLLENNQFIPYKNGYIDLIFEMLNKRDVMK